MSKWNSSSRKKKGTIDPAGHYDPSDTNSQLDEDAVHVDAHISSSDYAKRCKALLDLNNDLTQLGAGMLIELPRIVVIGGQSTGKSSLIEAVSGITVPRDSGTCTKCPMECSLSSYAETWSCEISLRFEYGSDGKLLPVSKTEILCSNITDKSSVEIWLRRAQARILNPHLPLEFFRTKSRDEIREWGKTDEQTLKFSMNVVRVDIKDPGATNLNFVDLPGLIQNESQDAIDLVKKLVVSYIRGERTLILVTIPMSDDMQNQQAVKLANEVDPHGDRTIGVLTKPDTLGPGATSARKYWKGVIEGSIDQKKHGYYCVKLPDDEERSRNTSRSDSQRLAAEWFDATEPWKDLVPLGRFGIPGFVVDISKVLVHLIETSLHQLMQDVNHLLHECEKDLGSLPNLLDPSTEVMSCLTKFCTDLRGAVYGDKDKTLAQRNRKRYAQFKGEIARSAPHFQPFTDPVDYDMPLFNDDDFDEPRSKSAKALGLQDVRHVIENSIAWELPNNVPFDAKKNLILQFTALWQSPAEACFEDVFAILLQVLDDLREIHFGRFRRLEEHIRYAGSLTRTEVDLCKTQALISLGSTLELERFPVFTQNTHYLQTLTDKWLLRYKNIHACQSRYSKSPLEYMVSAPSLPGSPRSPVEYEDSGPFYDDSTSWEYRALYALAKAGYPHLKSKDLVRLLLPDPYQQELEVMAEVRAYVQVAYKRIIDNIPLTIEHSLNQRIAEELPNILLENLLKELRDPVRLDELIAEDPALTKKRAGLEERRTRLAQIKQRLDDFARL